MSIGGESFIGIDTLIKTALELGGTDNITLNMTRFFPS